MNIAQLTRDLDAKHQLASALLAKHALAAQSHQEKDETTGQMVNKPRLFTAEERAEIQAAVDAGVAIKAQLDHAKGDANFAAAIAALTGGHPVPTPATGRQVLTLGQQWAASEAGKFFFDKRHIGTRNWASPVAELDDTHLRATTLTEDPASGGKLITPQYLPGIIELRFKKLTIRDLLASGTTDSTSITYMKETTFTNAAGAVAETAPKPESTLVFDVVVDNVRKIAHWLPVSEEMLEDVSQIRSYIDSRLRLGVELTEEDQLLNGDGVAPNLLGLLNRPGLTAAQPRGADTNADAIYKEMMKVFNASFIMPDGHVINPANWAAMQLSKETQGRYIGMGPFDGAQNPVLWGLPVDVTPSIVANTSLTGAFKQAAQIFDRGGLRVEASNSHQDFFIKNLVAIRAERRLALAVYRPAAFGTTTGLSI